MSYSPVFTFMLALLTPTTRKRCAWSLYSSRSAPSRGAAAPPCKPDPVEIISGQYGHRPKHSNIIMSSLKFLSKMGFVSFFSSTSFGWCFLSIILDLPPCFKCFQTQRCGQSQITFYSSWFSDILWHPPCYHDGLFWHGIAAATFPLKLLCFCRPVSPLHPLIRWLIATLYLGPDWVESVRPYQHFIFITLNAGI